SGERAHSRHQNWAHPPPRGSGVRRSSKAVILGCPKLNENGGVGGRGDGVRRHLRIVVCSDVWGTRNSRHRTRPGTAASQNKSQKHKHANPRLYIHITRPEQVYSKGWTKLCDQFLPQRGEILQKNYWVLNAGLGYCSQLDSGVSSGRNP